ncbi:hypothetical protein Tco_0864243 [Tanacetum coccineum]
MKHCSRYCSKVLLLFESTAHYAQSTARCESTAVMFEDLQNQIVVIFLKVLNAHIRYHLKELRYCAQCLIIENEDFVKRLWSAYTLGKPIVAISSTEAEYVAAASCCAQTAQNADFYQIIDFLTGCSINYSLLVDPDLIGPWLQQFWATASLKVINDVPHIRAKVAGKKILISEATIRADLLFDDENGVDFFPSSSSSFFSSFFY